MIRHAKGGQKPAPAGVDYRAAKSDPSSLSQTAKSAQPAPEWPAGNDVQADGRRHCGFVQQIGAVYIATVDGAEIGTFESRATAFGAALDAPRASKKHGAS